MTPLIDAELEKLDRRHAQLTKLSNQLVSALDMYHALMRDLGPASVGGAPSMASIPPGVVNAYAGAYGPPTKNPYAYAPPPQSLPAYVTHTPAAVAYAPRPLPRPVPGPAPGRAPGHAPNSAMPYPPGPAAPPYIPAHPPGPANNY